MAERAPFTRSTTDYDMKAPRLTDHSKPEAAEHVESYEFNDLDKQYDLKKIDTLGVDIENRDAVKGDDSDGKVDWTWTQIVATISLAGLYVGAQIPLYYVGGCLSFIAAELGATSSSVWLPVANTLAIAAVAPFVGYLQDIFGRRYITVGGSLAVCVGIIIVGTAHTFGQAVAGMAIAGSGAAITELTSLAGTAELVPINRRGVYLGMVTGFVFPFVPYILVSQLLSTYHTWRWTMWICLIYNAISLVGVLLFYFPKSHLRGDGITKSEILARIDYVGGLLSIVGLTLFLVGLQAGGYDHPWTSAYTLSTLIIGIILILAFIAWEWKFARYPIVPRELFSGQRVIAIAYLVAFVGGMNFYSILNFFPLSYSTLFNPDPIQVGLKGLPVAISIVIGAFVFNVSLSYFKNHNREILLIATIMMTAFGGALAVVTPDSPRTFVAMGTISIFGVGGVLVPPATLAITVAPDELIATAVALSLSVRVIGGSIGYTIYYNIFYQKLTARLPLDIVEYAVKAGLPLTSAKEFVVAILTDPTSVAKVPGVAPAILEAATIGSRWGYAYALKYVWYTSIAFGNLSIVAAAFLPNKAVAKAMTNRIAAKISH